MRVVGEVVELTSIALRVERRWRAARRIRDHVGQQVAVAVERGG